ncbi:MAG: LLM class flavin-dependent oxidoreductase [Chloroflexi bacterium]|nr:LLM class flavin-dependent oxidoreductase [Chloroflexota bacterium]
MRIGLILPSMGDGAGPDSLDAAAGIARELGWSSLWTTDHLLVPPGEEAREYGWMLECLTTLAWVAGRHPDLRIGTSVIIPAMRDAPQLAKEIATIDVLSGGRLTVGVGVGDRSDLPEWANLGRAERMDVRGAYLDESIALWRHLWGGRTEPFVGRFHELRDYTFQPLPIQGERLPIWSGGRSDRAVIRAASLADGYHASQTGPADLRARLPLLIETARSAGRPRPVISIRSRVRFDQPAGSVYSLCGSARSMAADLQAFDELGVSELVVVLAATTPDDLRAAARRFEREVVVPYRTAKRELADATREQYAM